MRIFRPIAIAILTLPAALLGGCATMASNDEPPRAASATIRDAAGALRGEAVIHIGAAGMELSILVSGLPAGTYGAHVHSVGQCAAPAFTSAGGHWNPASRQHGRLNPMGSHMGDLPNLVVGSDGRGELHYALPGEPGGDGEGGLLDADGAALVIHAAADDERTDPSGNSGARMACAVFIPA
ncbi:MAG: superoxide dismutase family protein [Pseudomonadota bacterium]